MSISGRYHHLVSLMYRFLRLQPFGWEGPGKILQSERFQLPVQFPAVLLLRELVQETDPGEMLSRQEMESRLYNPYPTLHPFFFDKIERTRTGCCLARQALNSLLP